MFERFTDRARRVVVLAHEEARGLGHNYIGTEHILLGLLRETGGVAARALKSMGIGLDAARHEIRKIIGIGEGQPAGHIPFTPRAKKVLELSLREALQLGKNYIGTEHILLGLLREGEGVGTQVLVTLGGDLNRVRQEVIHVLEGQQEESQRVSPPVRVVGSRIQLESLNARIGEVISHLGVILERLASIEERLASMEGHLAEGRRPSPRAPRKPPASRKPKSPPAEPTASARPPGEEAAGGEAQKD
jgi:ATP-dependent Clp protease ATP-binding subunit ClpA